MPTHNNHAGVGALLDVVNQQRAQQEVRKVIDLQRLLQPVLLTTRSPPTHTHHHTLLLHSKPCLPLMAAAVSSARVLKRMLCSRAQAQHNLLPGHDRREEWPVHGNSTAKDSAHHTMKAYRKGDVRTIAARQHARQHITAK